MAQYNLLTFFQSGDAVVNKPWCSSVVCAVILLLISLLMGSENSSCELPSNICKLQTCAVSAMTVLLTILLSIVLCAQGEIPEEYIQPGPPDFCHRGSYHIMLKTCSIKTPHCPKTAVSRSACLDRFILLYSCSYGGDPAT